jgi:hypothetical protein
MNSRRPATSLLVILCVPLLFGCSVFSVLAPAPASGTQVPIQLERCSNYPAALCLDSFGLGQGQLLITFYSPAAGSSEFFLKVWQGDAATTYPCTLADASPTTIYCTGPLIPLGTPVKIDLYTKTGRIPLAEGEFALNGLAVPTLPSGEAGTSASPSGTPPGATAEIQVSPSRTLPAATAETPALATGTPPSGTAYPNPAYP